jgi:hypothetical protein
VLASGFLAQTGKRTVCGMLAGAGLSRLWPHDRAHSLFARARWNPDELGLAAARLVVALLVPAGDPVTIAVDDTVFRRRGKKIWAASWIQDGSARSGQDRVRQQPGHRRHRGQAAPAEPPGSAAGPGQAGHQGHQLRVPAIAGPPDGRIAGRCAARPGHPRHR